MGKDGYFRKLALVFTAALFIPLATATMVSFQLGAGAFDTTAARLQLALLLAMDVCALPAVWWGVRRLTAYALRPRQRMYLDIIQTLAMTLEMKDRYTEGHSRRVAAYAAQIAAGLGWTPAQVARINVAGLLHDIGKIGITEQILNKPGALTREEYEIIKTHPTIAARILSRLDDGGELVAWIEHHHERYDGRGYPAGLVGEAIPLGARILAVADAFDAMTSTRAYRCGFPRSEALRDLTVNAGSQFDPRLVRVFLLTLRRATRLPA